MCSNWPVHSTKTPPGSLASRATTCACLGDEVGGVAPADVHPHVIPQESILALDRRRALDDLDLRHLGERHLPWRRGLRRRSPARADAPRAVTGRFRIDSSSSRQRAAAPDDDRMPLAALDRVADHLAGQGRLDHSLTSPTLTPSRGGPLAVEADLDIRLAADRVGHHVDGPAQRLDHPGDLFRAADDVVEVPAQHADADRRVDARRQHVDPVLDRHRPDVRPARHLDGQVELAAERRQLVAIGLPEHEPAAESARELVLDRVEHRLRLEQRGRGRSALASVMMAAAPATCMWLRRGRHACCAHPDRRPCDEAATSGSMIVAAVEELLHHQPRERAARPASSSSPSSLLDVAPPRRDKPCFLGRSDGFIEVGEIPPVSRSIS